MADIILAVIGLLIPIFMLVTTYFIGSHLEKKHFSSIVRREREFINLPAVSGKIYLDSTRKVRSAVLVTGETVVSIDYFKRFLGSLKNLIGGEVVAFESVLDRARREAVLRMKEQAPNADIIINLKVETSNIGNVDKNGGTGCSEVIAYGTAVTYED